MRARVPRCRLFSGRLLALLLFFIAFVAYYYYYSNPVSLKKPIGNELTAGEDVDLKASPAYFEEDQLPENEPQEQCAMLPESQADIDTVTTYPQFEFQPSWVRTKEFWDKSFEERYEAMRNDSRRPKLKVIVVPHSHNDPGWLKTFEQYFEWKTKDIINNIVHKLHEHPEMTFIWTEISFLNAWWERAHPVKQKALKKLIKEGRLEITTGGWVMPDEACTHIYALVDQFIEGHLWVKNNLGISPRTGWSIDPFGHGPTVPHLLQQSGLEGTIIQRIHYAWKQWLAARQLEEFYWLPGWASADAAQPSLIVHNQPFDIYSIKSTCGPHPSVCLSFDFRKIPGEYSEYTAKHEEITEQNLHAKAKTLMEEYDRIGSLTPHNVALVPLGDDFRYEFPVEFDAQYDNYMKLFRYINQHQELFHADVRFGTPLDYFEEVRRRHKAIPTLKGDFFVYSDIFSEGKPAYWSGYYTTRPYVKILARQLEHQLRTSEILFTLVSNYIKQSNNKQLIASEKRLEKSYEQLINARRNLGLFQHHDAITGTSKAGVMYDYGTKLFTSLYHCLRLQEAALAAAALPEPALHAQAVLQSELEWETYGRPPRRLTLAHPDTRTVLLFNPLMETRTDVVTLRSNTTDVRIRDTRTDEYVMYQISPIIDVKPDGRHVISESSFELMFVVTLPPLTAASFRLEQHANASHRALVFCNQCAGAAGALGPDKQPAFATKKLMPGDIQLENSALKLLVNRNTGFLRQIYRKDIKKKNIVEMQFKAYQSAQRHSGAYLFMPDYDAPEKRVLSPYSSWDSLQDENIIIVSGLVATEITTLYLPFLSHTIRIYNVDDPALSRAVFIESIVDFESPPKNRETELFMRIHTDIQNGDPPEFYTDQNGYQYQKRVKVDKIGIEGNYYPITTMAWLQDEHTRLTLVTDHAQGAAAFEPGRLELMLDRRTLYDDFRGVGEGIVDNKQTVFRHWLLLEQVASGGSGSGGEAQYQLPSPAADRLSRSLNYPINVYVVDTSEVGSAEVVPQRSFAEGFPEGLHLLTLRTLTDDILEQSPSSGCLMVLQRPGVSCAVGAPTAPVASAPSRGAAFTRHSRFPGLRISNLTAVSLTGLRALRPLRGLHEVSLDHMDLKTYKIVF